MVCCRLRLALAALWARNAVDAVLFAPGGCMRRLDVTAIATDSLTVRGHAWVAAWYGDVRSIARWRLRPAIEGASMMAGPCMPQRIPDLAVTGGDIHCIFFFLVAN